MRKISLNYLNELVIDSKGKYLLSDEQEHDYGGEIKNVIVLKDSTGDVVDWLYPNKYNQVSMSNNTMSKLLNT